MGEYDLRILFGDASYALAKEFPEHWAQPTAVTVAVFNDSGTELLSAQAATIPAATALNMASGVKRGRRLITLDGGTWVEGDRLRIAASVDGPAEDVVVESWESVGKVATLRDHLDHSHADNAVVSARYCTYALDVSDADDFPNLLSGWLLWDPDTDNQAIRQTYRIQKYDYAIAGLEQTFEDSYPRYHHSIPPGRFELYQERAIDVLADECEPHGREFRATVSEGAPRELIMLQLARLVIDGGGADVTTAEEERIIRRLSESLTNYRRLRRWGDEDEDGTKEPGEDQTYEDPLASRGL